MSKLHLSKKGKQIATLHGCEGSHETPMVKPMFCNSSDPVYRGSTAPGAKNTKRQNGGATESGGGTRRLVRGAAGYTTGRADDQDQGHNPGKKNRSLGAVASLFPEIGRASCRERV